MRGSNPGYLVETKSGKRGRTYHSDELLNGKVKIHIIDENFVPTGEKILCNGSDLKIKGFID